jgi:hypothetical protein
MKPLQNSNDNLVTDTFLQKKVLTIIELKELIPLSVRTIYNRLQDWKAINSYNKNGKYYTLSTIANFDSYGLWHYNDIHFSKHGNLKQTLIQLIKNSENGLNAGEIGELLRMDCRSFLWQFSKIKEIQRSKIDGIYVWFSTEADKYQQQKAVRQGQSKSEMAFQIKDSIAIVILVETIKNPEMDSEALSELLCRQGIKIKPAILTAFFSYYGIEKKKLLAP